MSTLTTKKASKQMEELEELNRACWLQNDVQPLCDVITKLTGAAFERAITPTDARMPDDAVSLAQKAGITDPHSLAKLYLKEQGYST